MAVCKPDRLPRPVVCSSTSMGKSSVWKDGGTATGSRLLGIASRCERRLFWPLSLRSETTRVTGLLFVVVTKKITVDESVPTRTLAFVGQEPKGRRVVLEMFSPHFILTAWDHRTEVVKVKIDRKLISLPLQADPSVLERERLAVLARDAANVSEFRVTGSLRTSWYEAQRRDPSLAGSLRRTEPSMRVAGDGLLERDVTLRTGQTVCVPVVPNGIAGANGVTWRRACYNAVHDGVLGAHRSAEATIKLLERAVWWPDLEADVKLWVSKCLACLKGRARPTKVEARAVKCSAETCWQEVSVDCEGPNREDRDGYRYSLTYFDCLSHAVLLEPLKSLTHSEVRRAFTRCVLRSRTLPALVRSDRGPEFKNEGAGYHAWLRVAIQCSFETL